MMVEEVGIPLAEAREHCKHLASLLSYQRRKQLARLLEMSWDPETHRVTIADVHESVFDKYLPSDARKTAIATANKAVNRLIDALNEAANIRRVPLIVRATRERQKGATYRHLWFEYHERDRPRR